LSRTAELSRRRRVFSPGEKIVPQLSEASFIAKEQAIRRMLDVADNELKELRDTEEEPDDDEDVDETEEQGTDTIT
jgi:hypothetical protein